MIDNIRYLRTAKIVTREKETRNRIKALINFKDAPGMSNDVLG